MRVSCYVDLSGIKEIDRGLAIAVTSSNLEFNIYSEAYMKGLIAKEEYEQRVASLSSVIAYSAGTVAKYNPDSEMLKVYKEAISSNN